MYCTRGTATPISQFKLRCWNSHSTSNHFVGFGVSTQVVRLRVRSFGWNAYNIQQPNPSFQQPHHVSLCVVTSCRRRWLSTTTRALTTFDLRTFWNMSNEFILANHDTFQFKLLDFNRKQYGDKLPSTVWAETVEGGMRTRPWILTTKTQERSSTCRWKWGIAIKGRPVLAFDSQVDTDWARNLQIVDCNLCQWHQRHRPTTWHTYYSTFLGMFLLYQPSVRGWQHLVPMNMCEHHGVYSRLEFEESNLILTSEPNFGEMVHTWFRPRTTSLSCKLAMCVRVCICFRLLGVMSFLLFTVAVLLSIHVCYWTMISRGQCHSLSSLPLVVLHHRRNAFRRQSNHVFRH